MDKETEQNYYERYKFESLSMASRIRNINPLLGCVIRVGNLEVSRELFEEEYEVLWAAYQKVIDKIKVKLSKESLS